MKLSASLEKVTATPGSLCVQIYTHIGYLSLCFSWSLCFKISALLLTELKDFRSTVAIHQHTGPHWTSSPPKISPHASTLSPAATQGAASAVASPDLPKHRQGGCLPALLPSLAARPLLARVSLLHSAATTPEKFQKSSNKY